MGEAKRRREAQDQRWTDAFDGVRLMIGTPTYGGQATTQYLEACEALAYTLGELGITYRACRPKSESLVPRARNYVAREFLESDCTHLLFIDADIVFQPSDVLALLETRKPFVGGAYPRKQIEWATVIEAARIGADDPGSYASSYVVNLLPEDAKECAVTYDEKSCVEVMDLPTGFLLCDRAVYERLRVEVDDIEYNDDAGPQRPIWNFFPIPVVNKRLLSEDYAFCRLWQGIGGKCHLLPSLELHHVGSHVFRANADRIFAGCVR